MTASAIQCWRSGLCNPSWHVMVGTIVATVFRVGLATEKKKVAPRILDFPQWSEIVCWIADFPAPAAPVMHSKCWGDSQSSIHFLISPRTSMRVSSSHFGGSNRAMEGVMERARRCLLLEKIPAYGDRTTLKTVLGTSQGI